MNEVCPDCGGLGDDNVKYEFNRCPTCKGTGKVPTKPDPCIFIPPVKARKIKPGEKPPRQ